MKRHGHGPERPEVVGRGRTFGVSDSRVVGRVHVQVAHAKLVLSLRPGHVAARQILVSMRQQLLSKLAPEDAGYGAIADIAAALDADVLAQLHRAGADMPELGPPSRQDPIADMRRMGKLDDQQYRAGQEIQQVAEMLSWASVGGVRAMDPSAIRVDGGGFGGLDLATYCVGHHALGRVNDFMAVLRSDSRRFAGKDGRQWTVADIFRAVVIDRASLNTVEGKIVIRHRVIGRLIADHLHRYAQDAKAIWDVIDADRARKS